MGDGVERSRIEITRRVPNERDRKQRHPNACRHIEA
jgi:hypothetical protein